jgi:hypothetical protein
VVDFKLKEGGAKRGERGTGRIQRTAELVVFKEEAHQGGEARVAPARWHLEGRKAGSGEKGYVAIMDIKVRGVAFQQ